MFTLIGATIAVRPAAMVWVMWLFSAINVAFLAASIAQAARGPRSGTR